jgi:hypothetical protein
LIPSDILHMSPLAHRIYIGSLVFIVVAFTVYLFYQGGDYYNTSLEERFYHADHKNLKPSGMMGHGLGIVGTLLILIGVFGYMARKRYRFLSRLGILKHWLEFHIFLCTLGPIMILFHTAFKFGGIVSISFWSMVAVVASGVLGRFIYLQIPRTIHGQELSMQEIHDTRETLGRDIEQNLSSVNININALIQEMHDETATSSQQVKGFIGSYFSDWKKARALNTRLGVLGVSSGIRKNVLKMVKEEWALIRKIERLLLMQRLFRYWHIAHLPFALIMLIIMVIHVGVTLAFGYTWIF